MAKHCIFLIALGILLVGCNKLNKTNYDKLKAGMVYDDVVAILGRPDTCSDTILGKACTWGDENRSIAVGFMAGNVIFYTNKNID